MTINIITVTSGWILQHIANRISNNNSSVFEVTHSPKDDVDANVYIDIQNCYGQKTKTLDVGVFTHLHEDSIKSVHPHWLTLDYMVHMCTRYYDKFQDIYPKDQMCVSHFGEIGDNFKIKKPVIGIFQRGEHVGKGFSFMQRLVSEGYDNILKKFKFVFVGDGWSEVVDLYKLHGISTFSYSDKDYSIYPKLYNNIDYLLIPSLWEGGPMSLIEACAVGIPIISTDVGWINRDFKVDYLFEPNNSQQLIDIFQKILKPLQDRRDRVSGLSYKKYGDNLIEIITKLKHEKA